MKGKINQVLKWVGIICEITQLRQVYKNKYFKVQRAEPGTEIKTHHRYKFQLLSMD